jgi:hypothetical protein
MLAAPKNLALTLLLVLSLVMTRHGATSVLKEGAQASVEQPTGQWYLVVAVDGQKGYVHKIQLQLAAEVTAQPAVPQTAPSKTNLTEAKEPAKDATPAAVPAAAGPPGPTKELPKPPSTPAPAKINSLEAKEPAKDAPPTVFPAAAEPPAPAKEPPKPQLAVTPAPRVEPPKVPEAKSQSILQMLEGHETEVKLGLIIAAIAFVLGWICGAGYHARRERKSRHKLRF